MLVGPAAPRDARDAVRHPALATAIRIRSSAMRVGRPPAAVTVRRISMGPSWAYTVTSVPPGTSASEAIGVPSRASSATSARNTRLCRAPGKCSDRPSPARPESRVRRPIMPQRHVVRVRGARSSTRAPRGQDVRSRDFRLTTNHEGTSTGAHAPNPTGERASPAASTPMRTGPCPATLSSPASAAAARR